jgi:hypothetical protein
MIALLILLAAQAAPGSEAPPASEALPTADAATASTPARAPQVCRKAAGSDTVVCTPVPQQQLGYRLPKYGPAAPQAKSANRVKVGARTTNRGPARRNRSMATVGIPF